MYNRISEMGRMIRQRLHKQIRVRKTTGVIDIKIDCLLSVFGEILRPWFHACGVEFNQKTRRRRSHDEDLFIASIQRDLSAKEYPREPDHFLELVLGERWSFLERKAGGVVYVDFVRQMRFSYMPNDMVLRICGSFGTWNTLTKDVV